MGQAGGFGSKPRGGSMAGKMVETQVGLGGVSSGGGTSVMDRVAGKVSAKFGQDKLKGGSCPHCGKSLDPMAGGR